MIAHRAHRTLSKVGLVADGAQQMRHLVMKSSQVLAPVSLKSLDDVLALLQLGPLDLDRLHGRGCLLLSITELCFQLRQSMTIIIVLYLYLGDLPSCFFERGESPGVILAVGLFKTSVLGSNVLMRRGDSSFGVLEMISNGPLLGLRWYD